LEKEELVGTRITNRNWHTM